MRHTATAFAPGSIGNVGPGLDMLGLAVAGRGDEVTLARTDTPSIVIADPGHPQLPTDPTRHAAAIAVQAVFTRLQLTVGVSLRLTKGLPLSGGQGGSAASAIAGAVAANHLVDGELDTSALLACALEAEATVAGRHADNLAPSLLGGLVLIRSLDPPTVFRLPLPNEVRIVLVRPDQQLQTRDARAVLPAMISRADAIAQATHVAELIAGACTGNAVLLGQGIVDLIAEPVRAPMLPGFLDAKRAALAAGALGCSISGAGPTAFALVDNVTTGTAVAAAMVAAYARAGIAATSRVAEVDRTGARVR